MAAIKADRLGLLENSNCARSKASLRRVFVQACVAGISIFLADSGLSSIALSGLVGCQLNITPFWTGQDICNNTSTLYKVDCQHPAKCPKISKELLVGSSEVPDSRNPDAMIQTIC